MFPQVVALTPGGVATAVTRSQIDKPVDAVEGIVKETASCGSDMLVELTLFRARTLPGGAGEEDGDGTPVGGISVLDGLAVVW